MTIALIHPPGGGTALAGALEKALATTPPKGEHTLQCLAGHQVFETGAPKADAIFLEVNSMFDVEVGRKLHQLGAAPGGLVVVSGSGDYSLEAFDMDARQYLVQPVSHAQFCRAIARCAAQLPPA